MLGSDMKSVRVNIHGRVQGVWYRDWTVAEAGARKLNGWVRNRSDGTVEALFHGPAHHVDDMVQACHRGSPAAHVIRVDVEPSEPPAHEGFRREPTL